MKFGEVEIGELFQQRDCLSGRTATLRKVDDSHAVFRFEDGTESLRPLEFAASEEVRAAIWED